MQVGVQGMSDDSYETAHRYIKDGALGKVVLAQIDYSRNHVGDFWTETVDEGVRPGENLDWKAFLGPAKKRPFDADRFFAWRRYWDYSGGVATDLFIHRLTRIIKACGLTVPSQVVATGGKFGFPDSSAEIPDTFNVLIDYPEGMTVSLVNSMANAKPIRHLIRGHEATLEFTPEGFFIEPEKEFADKRSRIEHKKTGAEDLTLHHRNLINAIRLNEPLKCDARLGFYGMLACRMAVDSYRRKEYLAWDPRREKVVKA
jgi:predicted dehydrogenase